MRESDSTREPSQQVRIPDTRKFEGLDAMLHATLPIIGSSSRTLDVKRERSQVYPFRGHQSTDAPILIFQESAFPRVSSQG